MIEAPTPLARPVVVLNGYRGLPTLASRVARKLREMTSGRAEDFLAVSYWTSTDLDAIAAEVVRRVDEAWPSEDPERTVEVDVVGISMGGVVARWAAMAPEQRVREGEFEERQAGRLPHSDRTKRLRIARLYTIATPHQGAVMANLVAPDAAARDLRTGSAFLAALDSALPGAGYELVCYAQTNDKMVGALHAAPQGTTPFWCSGTWAFSHFMAADNPMFLADIARRLRGEEPILKAGGAPLSD
jgi:pimeloyl-ACP methyl ester carboxylesterase